MSDLLTICKSIFILINTVSVFGQNKGLNKQQIFYWKRGFDITKEYANPIYEGTFPVLECSTHLKNCLYNDEDFERFYRFCFKEQCSFGNYHCLNVNATTSLNLCGRLEDCNKRSRRIVLLDEINRTVDVYTVPCPDGAVQINLKKCFDPCVKDVAIVVQKPSSGNVPAIAYCNSAEGFCNPNKSMFFSTGSAYDDCIDAELEGRCHNELDLLPDCSCVDKCPLGQLRSPLSNFTCSGEINNTTYIANKLTKTTPNSFPGQQHHTSIDAGEIQKQGEESRQEQSSSISTLAIGFISGSVLVLAIAVLVGVICILKLVQNQRSHGIQSNPVTYRIKHFYKVKNKTKVKTMLPEHNDREISNGQMCDDVVSLSSASPSRPETIGAETSDHPDQQLNELKAPFLVGSQESAQRYTDSETEVLKPCSV